MPWDLIDAASSSSDDAGSAASVVAADCAFARCAR
jgi:hypothetical protein